MRHNENRSRVPRAVTNRYRRLCVESRWVGFWRRTGRFDDENQPYTVLIGFWRSTTTSGPPRSSTGAPQYAFLNRLIALISCAPLGTGLLLATHRLSPRHWRAEILIFEEGVSRILIYMSLVSLAKLFHRGHCRLNRFHDSGVNLPVKSNYSRIDLRYCGFVRSGAVENGGGIQFRYFPGKMQNYSTHLRRIRYWRSCRSPGAALALSPARLCNAASPRHAESCQLFLSPHPETPRSNPNYLGSDHNPNEYQERLR